MVAAMAIELFVYLYAFAFGLSAFIAVVLLVTAARWIGRNKERQGQKPLGE